MHTLEMSLQALLGEKIDKLDTPALVVDLDAATRNMQRMMAFTEKHGIRLRPNTKMHKSPAFATLQVQAGAVGVCTLTVSGAEAMAQGGIHDIYLKNQVLSPGKLQRVALLAERLQRAGGRMAIAVDSLEGIQRLHQAMAIVKATIDVFVEVDIGHGRCGVEAGEPALELVTALKQIIDDDPRGCMRYAGLQAYQGGIQHIRSLEERAIQSAASVARLRGTMALLTEAGLKPPLVTGGGTGSFLHETASGLWNELQPGSFLFMDASYLANEPDPAQPKFEAALYLKSQVISVSAHHAVCDAGAKAYAQTSGMPLVWPLPGQPMLQVSKGGDEHSRLLPMGDDDGLPQLPRLGETVWMIPYLCDPAVNLHAHLFVVRGGLVDGWIEDILPVTARGHW